MMLEQSRSEVTIPRTCVFAPSDGLLLSLISLRIQNTRSSIRQASAAKATASNRQALIFIAQLPVAGYAAV